MSLLKSINDFSFKILWLTSSINLGMGAYFLTEGHAISAATWIAIGAFGL